MAKINASNKRLHKSHDRIQYDLFSVRCGPGDLRL